MCTGSVLSPIQPADRLRIMKLKQLAEVLVLINYFVETAPQSLVPPARNLVLTTCCPRP